MEFKDGDTITVNGKPCRIESGALVPVNKKGPLGGEPKRLGELKWKAGQMFICYAHPSVMQPKSGDFVNCYITNEDKSNETAINLPIDLLVETNVPPRPQFILTTAGEAAKLHDIVGRWVAVNVDDCGMNYICSQKCDFMTTDQILLIEGVDLP